MSDKEQPHLGFWALSAEEQALIRGMLGGDETTLPASSCPECGKNLDVTEGTGKPKPGDFTLCAYCASVNTFDEDLKIRALTDEEVEEVAQHAGVQFIRYAIQKAAQRKEGAHGG